MRRRSFIVGAATSALMGCVGAVPSDACEEEPVSQWVRYAGRIMVFDNSIGIGYVGLIGGFRPSLASELAAAGVGSVYVGPYSDAYGAHYSVSGTSAGGQSSDVQTVCATHRPRIVILGLCENDLGTSASPSQAIESMRSCIRWAFGGAPWTIPIVRSVIVPQTNGIPGYYSRRELFADYNTLLPALCAEEGARHVDIGAPTTSDGLHPDDTSTGYPSMGAILAAAVLASLPGGA